jgi:polyphosphate kinase
MLNRVVRGLGAADDQIYRISGLLDLADLTEISAIERPNLKDDPWVPRTPLAFAPKGSEDPDLFAAIAREDQLVHHPYDSFANTFQAFVTAAAGDDAVTAMKTSVYRTNEESPLVPALIQSAEAGKQSVCLVELKARFDERRNIEWARALERAGVHVVYGFPNLKIHAKMTLIVREEAGELKRYVHLGTGNYHALTARLYEDLGLFTADEDIAADVADLFNHITGFGRPQAFRKILVAPFGLREGLIAEIRRVATAAKSGKTARIRIKVNQLTDTAVIKELYAASEAGAEIDIVSRTISSLWPGVDGMSERIRVRSIFGRFLEHSRIFAFQAGKKSSYYIGSADLMPRNLDHRIEVVAPIETPVLQQRLSGIFDTLLGDNVNAWELQPDGSWERTQPDKDDPSAAAHDVLMRKATRRARLVARKLTL